MNHLALFRMKCRRATGVVVLLLQFAVIGLGWAMEISAAEGGTRSILPADAGTPTRRLLYVATPGIRDYLEYGGHGVLVFDIDAGYQFVKRIASAGVNAQGKP